MAGSFGYICGSCGRTYEWDTVAWRCCCGGLFRLDGQAAAFSRPTVGGSLWRYLDALPFSPGEGWEDITLGEGGTPLVKVQPGLLAKADYYMPTLSFKDRGAVMLAAHAARIGADRVVADSSGNAGTAIAAYCARAGMACHVFVPASASPKKLRQIEAHGAVLHAIPGSREDTAAAAIAMVEEIGAFYASHIFNPFFWEGTKTYFYEVYEELGGNMPDAFVIPVGNGTLLMGAYLAFQEMLRWGWIDKAPRIMAVQAGNCAPIYTAWQAGGVEVAPCENKGTAAEGIAIAAPARGGEILAALRENGGTMLAVGEAEIAAAQAALARRGIFVEITSAANYAGYLQLLEREPGLEGQEVVMPLCGAGLKSQ